MYKCKWFDIEELVPEKVFLDRGEMSWELLDKGMLLTLDRLRDIYGPITVNDWKWGGEREWSGLRTPDSPYYSPYSQHTFGRAADCIFHDVSVEKVREDILARGSPFSFIQAIELNTSWLHFDVRNTDKIKTFTK